MRRKSFLLLVIGLLSMTLLSGCFGNNFVSKTPLNVQVTRDLVDYAGLDYAAGEVLVKANFGQDLVEVLADQGSEVVREWSEIGWVLATVPAGETELSFIEKLKSHKEVLLVEPNLEFFIPDQPPAIEKYALNVADDNGEDEEEEHEIDFILQWGLRDINAEAAWEITTGSSDVIVAIVDSGVDTFHPEFADKEFVGTYSACYNDPAADPLVDLHGHGSHVAGIAAANGTFGKVAGVAWDCDILSVRVMNNDGNILNGYLTEAMMYLGYYAEANPDKRIVANMSIGGRGYSFAFKDAIDFAAERGVLLITSAGNDYKRMLSYPSAYNGPVSVAATTPHGVKTDFSTTGWWNSVGAPGDSIYSTHNFGGYTYMGGTSMASPFVTGAAALLLAEYPELTPAEIRNQLEQTARGEGFTEELGYGIIDAEALLGEIKPMAYGGLKVFTDLHLENQLGTVTVFDAGGQLVAYGSTGAEGTHVFSILKPGEYTVAVSYYDSDKGEYAVKSKLATVNKNVFDTKVEF